MGDTPHCCMKNRAKKRMVMPARTDGEGEGGERGQQQQGKRRAHTRARAPDASAPMRSDATMSAVTVAAGDAPRQRHHALRCCPSTSAACAAPACSCCCWSCGWWWLSALSSLKTHINASGGSMRPRPESSTVRASSACHLFPSRQNMSSEIQGPTLLARTVTTWRAVYSELQAGRCCVRHGGRVQAAAAQQPARSHTASPAPRRDGVCPQRFQRRRVHTSVAAKHAHRRRQRPHARRGRERAAQQHPRARAHA